MNKFVDIFIKMCNSFRGETEMIFSRLTTNQMVGVAAVGGIITGVTGLTLHSAKQTKVKESPIFQWVQYKSFKI